MTDQDGSAYVYTVTDGETGKDAYYLSPLPPELASRKGIPPQAILGKLTHGPESFDAEHFEPNPGFAPFLHRVLAKHAADCPGITAALSADQEGFITIFDLRTAAPGGAVPSRDIIGVVEVRGGQVVRYQGNPDYHPFTRDGLMLLDPWFRDRLLEELAALGEDSSD